MGSPWKSQKFDVLRMLPACLPELPALANVVIVVAPCVVPRQPLAALLESTSHGQQKKEKNANQHTNGLQLLNTTCRMSQFKKTSHMFGTHKNVPARANPVCAVHRPCLRKDRKRASRLVGLAFCHWRAITRGCVLSSFRHGTNHTLSVGEAISRTNVS